MATAEDQNGEDEVQRQVTEEYKVWKKNAPFLYDIVMTHALEWPSLTVDWLPIHDTNRDKEYSEQQLVLGTHTANGDPNYLMIAKVKLPLPDAEIDARKYDDEKGELGGFGSAAAKVSISIKIPHDGEVNRARHCPHNGFMIATKSVSADTYIFDTTRHPSEPKDRTCRPELTLGGHDAEGYGLAWSPIRDGHLLSGANDSRVLMWDLRGKCATSDKLLPHTKFNGHTGIVEAVAWSHKDENVLGSVGDDCRLIVWDKRTGAASHTIEAHKQEANGLSFSPFNEHLLLSAGSDKVIHLRDLRRMENPIHTFQGHDDEVVQVEWSPFSASIFSTVSADRRAAVWDMARIGAEQSPEDAADGPPELLFIHGGHTAKLSDMSWNLKDDWVMATVAEDNILQIWQMAEAMYLDEGEEDDAVGAGGAGEGGQASGAGGAGVADADLE